MFLWLYPNQNLTEIMYETKMCVIFKKDCENGI